MFQLDGDAVLFLGPGEESDRPAKVFRPVRSSRRSAIVKHFRSPNALAKSSIANRQLKFDATGNVSKFDFYKAKLKRNAILESWNPANKPPPLYVIEQRIGVDRMFLSPSGLQREKIDINRG